MTRHRFLNSLRVILLQAVLCLGILACNSVRHVQEGEHLLVKNNLKIKSDRSITKKGPLTDQLNLLVLQKPNTYWSGIFPFKLWRYNLRSEKYINNPQLELPKSLERPVIYDSVLQRRTVTNMINFLQNQGYFNAVVTDTVRFKKKKAYAQYHINTGLNYKVNKVYLDIDDSTIAGLVQKGISRTLFKTETDYTKGLADEERSRIIALLQDNGYYKFSQDNIRFELDTFNKANFRDADNLFESAINFITLQKQLKKHALDIKIVIRANSEPSSYQQYKVGRVVVFPDFVDREDARDTTMHVTNIDGVLYRFRERYIKEQVLNRQIFIRPGALYSRKDHELTINKLNELGIFQQLRIVFREDTVRRDSNVLSCFILLNPAKKLDAALNTEIANATTYPLGSSIGISYRDKNLFQGANLLTISATGGVEINYNEQLGEHLKDYFYLQSKNMGLNASLQFPKFIVPFKPTMFSGRNLPRTQLNFGINILDRIDQFQITNISSSFGYNWRQSATHTWDFTPAFANIVLPTIRPAFQGKLDSNDFLKNTYRRTFIEGESIAFTFSDQIKKQGHNYKYLRIAMEEAGLIMSGINTISKNLGPTNASSKGFIFDQYVKLDLDARKYFTARHSSLALRFLAGIGNPYGDSRTLPYVKQYFVGGPYSIRGWRPRTLGPVSVSDTNNIFIDRTGDIKLEMNAEFRFDMIQLFSGTLNLNGALFADAGNTWLAKKSADYPNGQLDINRLGQDIAMSTGAGLRIIVAGFFTVRLDAAFPIKNPYIKANSGWILDKVDLGNQNWRKDNVVLNVAIGMPF